MRGFICQAATPRYFEGHGWVGRYLAFSFLAMVIVLNAAIVSIAMVWNMSYAGVLTRWPGFLLRDCRWLFLGPSLLSWMPIRSRH